MRVGLENRLAGLETCVAQLPLESQRIILDYYTGEESAKIANRKRLAEPLTAEVFGETKVIGEYPLRVQRK